MAFSVSMKGLGEAIATFETQDTTLKPGDPVALSGNNSVIKAADEGLFVGVCKAVRGGFASVQLSGYAEVKYSGTAPTVGFRVISADGNGGVALDPDGREHLVLFVDTTASTCGIII